MVQIGDAAPDFTLDGVVDGEITTVTLSDHLDGRPAILAFYIYDFNPVCTEQVCEIDDMEFATFDDDIRVFGISTDGPFAHRRFAEDHDISYPLLTDDTRWVYEQYGMYREADDGTRELSRGIVVIDPDWKVVYRWVADDNWDDRGMEAIAEAVDAAKAATE